MIVRRVDPRAYARLGQPFGPMPGYSLAYGDITEDVKVTEKTALAGLGLWILGGVLTHVAVRLVDSWFFKEKR